MDYPQINYAFHRVYIVDIYERASASTVSREYIVEWGSRFPVHVLVFWNWVPSYIEWGRIPQYVATFSYLLGCIAVSSWNQHKTRYESMISCLSPLAKEHHMYSLTLQFALQNWWITAIRYCEPVSLVILQALYSSSRDWMIYLFCSSYIAILYD